MIEGRISQDEYFMGVARVVALRSTCSRRRVGCIMVNGHNHIIATGHNGVPRNMPHCIDRPCGGILHGTGTGLDKCMAVHAEANALMQCSDIMRIVRVYCTAMPCVHCMKMIMNTSAEQVIYDEEYPCEMDFTPQFSIRQFTPRMEIDVDPTQSP
jgi:dCMP deaminase